LEKEESLEDLQRELKRGNAKYKEKLMEITKNRKGRVKYKAELKELNDDWGPKKLKLKIKIAKAKRRK